MATDKDSKGRIGRGFVPVSYITSSDPTEDTGVAQDIQLDSLLKYAEKCNPFVWKMTAEEMWKLAAASSMSRRSTKSLYKSQIHPAESKNSQKDGFFIF